MLSTKACQQDANNGGWKSTKIQVSARCVSTFCHQSRASALASAAAAGDGVRFSLDGEGCLPPCRPAARKVPADATRDAAGDGEMSLDH